jgi:hypothetical protein
MNDLRPILENNPTDAEFRLLGSTRLDIPPPDGKGRLLVALGLGVGAAAVAAPAAAGTAAAAAGTSTVTTTVVSKWLALGAVAGMVVTGTGELARPLFESHALAHAPNTALESVHHRSAAAPQVARPSAGAAQVTPFADTIPAPGSDRAEPGSRPNQRATLPSAPPRLAPETESSPRATFGEPPPTLTDEVAALDAARSALAAPNPERALALLDAHDGRFQPPQLGPESTLLRVETLLALGRGADARPLGERFLASAPGSTHAERMRKLLAAGVR